ncbi:DUF7553 family protein [Haloarchaeobius amylolyticus]|uniref:DUF7553 family protein n=1 Tax=Haloarchaeobius amylolyticus TaxID=1198296 RepID=UPI00227084A0|nr:hypothetical protein [Haloarchaeobius amylolyticus]
MVREALQSASDLLSEAAESASEESRERLQTQADQFAKHAEAERGPDHGRLAKHERILADVADTEGGEVETKIDEALEKIREYRSTVEGV